MIDPHAPQGAPVVTAASSVQGSQFEGQVSAQTTSAEHPDVRAARLTREELEARNKIWMQRALFIVGVVVVGGVLVFCGIVIVRPGSSPEDKSNAWRVVIAVSSGVLGFIVGRSGSSSS